MGTTGILRGLGVQKNDRGHWVGQLEDVLTKPDLKPILTSRVLPFLD